MTKPYTDLHRSGDLITEDEQIALFVALANGQGNFSEDEAERLIEWARLQRTGATVVDMLISGSVTVTLREGAEPVIKRSERDEPR